LTSIVEVAPLSRALKMSSNNSPYLNSEHWEQAASCDLESLFNTDHRGTRKLLDHQAFSECLIKERVRCDRGGAKFCLLIFESTDASKADTRVKQISDILSEHLRITDELGHLEQGVRGAILTDTSVEGAWTVARKVVQMLPDEIGPPRASVYSYPTDTAYQDDPKNNLDAIVESTDRTSDASDSGYQPESKPLQRFFTQRLTRYQRIRDILAAGSGLVILSPLLLTIAAVIKCTSKGPILFRQQRTGLGGKPFTILKFRTMREGAEAEKAELLSLSEQDGPAFKMTADPRITNIGGVLRRTSMDELPQLWNVLCGDMTLVGPRPLPCEETASCSNWQRRRLDVTPGLTCTWQVSGRSTVSFSEWMRLDLDYIQRRTVSGDLSLIVRTIQVVFKGTGR
jgi:lipopolysaccharide/colanic/teichoic acid biosynthesis glycosyltransferase